MSISQHNLFTYLESVLARYVRIYCYINTTYSCTVHGSINIITWTSGLKKNESDQVNQKELLNAFFK